MNKIVEDYRLEGAEGRADRGRAEHPTLFSGHFVQSIVHPMMAHRTSVWPLLAEGHPFFRGHRDISDVLDILSILYFRMF